MKVRNNALFPLKGSFKIVFDNQEETSFHTFFLQPKMNRILIREKFKDICNSVTFSKVQFKFFNFNYIQDASIWSPLKL